MSGRLRSLSFALLAGAAFCAAFAARADVEQLDFTIAIQRILERSTAVAAQRATLGARVAADLPARLFYLPSVGLAAKRGLVGSEFDKDSYGNSLMLDARLNVFRFGGDVAAWAAASSDEDAERAELANQVLAAEQDAVESLVRFVSAVQEVSVSRKSLGLQEELIRIGRARFDRGLLPMQEVDKLAIDLENIRSSVADSEIRLAEASAKLDALLGGPRVAAVWPWKKSFLAPKPGIPGGEGGLENRPDLQAALARADAEKQRYRQSVAGALPTVDLSYGYGYTSGALAAARDDGRSWSGAIALNIPLFDRLTNYSAARAQAFRREGAEARLEQARRSALQDLESARASFSIARQSALAREKALEVSGKVFGDSQKRFQLGRLDANALTVDQSRLLSAELNAVRGWAALHTTASRLCHAQGLRLADCLKAE
jgi:outer membrane protein TolC